MKKEFVSLVPYMIALGADFYLLPLLMRDTGSAMLLMLCIMPLAALVIGVAWGVRHGFRLWLPVIAAALFFPSIFLFYNLTAWVYAIVYGAAVLAGMGIGRIFYRKK